MDCYGKACGKTRVFAGEIEGARPARSRRGFARSGSSRRSFRRILSRQRSAGLDFRAVETTAKTEIKNCAKTAAQKIFLILHQDCRRETSHLENAAQHSPAVPR